MKTILKYEWLLFRRNKLMLMMVLFMLLAGIYALQYGYASQQKQINVIYSLDTAYQARIQKQVNDFSADTSTKEGKQAYQMAHDPFTNEYYTHPVIWKQPSPLQALSIGQSDNQPYYNNLWLYNDFIYSNNEVELRNPDKLLSGNFDLAFFTIYLLPIFIIAFSYSVFSADKEAGITPLLAAQGVAMQKIILGRLLFRFLVVAVLVMALDIAGFLLNSVDSIETAILWLCTILLYLLFWFAFVYMMVSFKKTGAITALLLVGAWVLFLVVIPSLINNLSKTEDAERLELSDADREYSIHLWDQWQSKTTVLIDSLFLEMPHWKKYGIKDTNEVNSIAYAYFNMLYMNRLGARFDSLAVNDEHRLQGFNIINPAFVVQSTMNQLAGTELISFVDYRKEAFAYQKKRAEVVHELRLSGKPFTRAIFESYPVFRQPQFGLATGAWIKQLAPLIIAILFCSLVGLFVNNSRRSSGKNINLGNTRDRKPKSGIKSWEQEKETL